MIYLKSSNTARNLHSTQLVPAREGDGVVGLSLKWLLTIGYLAFLISQICDPTSCPLKSLKARNNANCF